MIMYYHMTEQNRSNFIAFLDLCPVKGRDAAKIVDIKKSVGAPVRTEKDGSIFVQMDEKLVKFAANILQDITIQAKFAVVFLEVLVALGKPLKELPKAANPVQVKEK